MNDWRVWASGGAAAVGALTVALGGAALSADHAEMLPDDPIKPTLVATCTACHDASEFATRRFSADGWDVVVSKMIDLGAEVSDKDRPLIIAYLAKNFGPKSAPPPGPPTAPVDAPPAPGPAVNAP